MSKNIKAETYKGIYSIHKYWGKKPFNLIRYFIKKYSSEKDIILDPFCGSGITIIESILLGRKAIGIDINPSAIFITEQTIMKIDTEVILKYFEKIKNNIESKINSFYEIKRDGQIIPATHFIWEDGKLTEIWYSNSGKKKKVFKPLKEDELKANEIKIEDITYFYPKTQFFHNPRINTKKNQKIFELFTPRNLYALSLLYKEIEKIKDKNISDFFKFVFTSSLGQSSKMVFIIKRRGKKDGNKVEKKEVGSWVIGYWIPKNFFEINVWKNFETRFYKIFKAKKEQLNLIYEINKTKNIQNLISNDYNLCLLNQPAQKALKNIPDNTIDYIITDPPHGDRIPYLELGMLWNSWLKKEPYFEDEIVISNAKERQKDINNYNSLLNKVFSEIYRVLKPNKHFSLIFNSLDDETWINLIQELFNMGFVLSEIETLDYSANSVVQDNRKRGLKTDFVLTFIKCKEKKAKLKILTIKDNKDYLEKNIEKIIYEQENKEFYNLINHIFKFFLNKGEFFKLSEIVHIINEKVR